MTNHHTNADRTAADDLPTTVLPRHRTAVPRIIAWSLVVLGLFFGIKLVEYWILFNI